MSDAGRKDFTSKAKESMQPDSSKSTLDKMGEGATDTMDKAARTVQGDGSKSGTQSAADKMGRSKDDAAHGGTGESVMDKAKGALGMQK